MSPYLETTVPIQRTASSTSSSRGEHVIMYGVSWETYERLLAEHEGNSGTHFTYDKGTLEIMVLSAYHEVIKDALVLTINLIAEEFSIDAYGLGSTTFQRKDLERGFEPDACFYIQNEAQVRGKKELDLTVDPPPDLIIEVDITSPSLNKFPLFAALGIPEVWRYDGERVGIFILINGQYIEQAESRIFLKVTGEVLTEFIDASQSLKRTVWVRRVRAWARRNLP